MEPMTQVVMNAADDIQVVLSGRMRLGDPITSASKTSRRRAKSRNQIRIGDELTPESDGVDQAASDQFFRLLRHIGARSQDNARERLPDRLLERIAVGLAAAPIRL